MKRRALGLRWALLAASGVGVFNCSGDGDDSAGGGGAAQAGIGNEAGAGAGAAAPDPRGGGGDAGAGTGAQAGAGAGAHAGAGGAMGGSGGRALAACTSPQLDDTTGLVRCAEGYLHRPEATGCGSGAGGRGGAGGGGGTPTALCYDAQSYGGGTDYCDTCTTDEDCPSSHICVCNGDQGVCMPSNCKVDADCGEGLLCASYQQGCGPSGFACQTPNDECRSNGDCRVEGDIYGVCAFGVSPSDDRRACDGTVCGRPFLVEASARIAPTLQRSDWCSETPAPSLEHLTPAECAALAEHWGRLGQMEHASIAAFARFQLQLLALGAPPTLVEACTRALADETAHAKLCFHLASAYAGLRVGPGPLDISGSLSVTSLAEVVDLVIHEGCYGETGAALDAFEAAENATDPVIADAYSTIANDEQRHAELAFRFVRWALEQSPAIIASRLSQALLSPPAHSPALTAIVNPCFEALLARRAAA